MSTKSHLTIAYYSPFWPPGFGKPNGIVTYVANIKRALTMRGHRVIVLSKSVGPDADPASSIAVPGLGARGEGGWQAKLARLMGKETSPRTIFAHNLRRVVQNHPDIDLLELEESHGLYQTVTDGLGKPSVIRLHGPWYNDVRACGKDPSDPANEARCEREAEAFRNAQAATAPTQAVLDGMIEEVGIRPPLARALFNPVSLPAEPVSIDRARAQRLLLVARMDYRKGIDVALKAFDSLAARHPDLSLTLVGPEGGFVEDGRSLSLSDLVARFVREPARSRITYHGIQSREQVDGLRRDHGLTLVASRYETFGYVLAEAMAVGSAVVSTPFPGSDELIKHGERGVIAADFAPESLAEALDPLIGDAERQASLGRAARTFVADVLSYETVGRETEDFYRDAIERYRDGR